MPAIDEDDKPKKKVVHDIGQDLNLLSVEELDARVQLLRDEISRLEADMTQKRASRAAADTVFQAMKSINGAKVSVCHEAFKNFLALRRSS